MAKKSTSFKAALSFPNRTIAHFYSQIEQQKQVLLRIHEVLPVAIAQHALHCVVNGKKLLIYTDTAAWASQLRFYNSAVLAAIAPVTRESVSIMQIKVRMEASATAFQPGRTPNIPSAEKIELIHNHSLTVSDEQLKRALQRLSATLAKRSVLRSRSG
jgi:Dna[CI] antecedent, DciA